MSRLTSSLLAAAVIGHLVIGSLGWVDPLFIPLALLGPVITGAVAAARGILYAWVAVLWFSGGIAWLWTDWVINNEDQAFHAALSVVMVVLAGIGFGVVRLAGRVRVGRRQASTPA